MRHTRLRWLILLPTILTFTFGFGALAVYIDSVERSNLLADVDDELVRAERSATIGGSGADRANDGAPDGPGDGDGRDLADDVDPPVELLLSADGDLLRTGSGRNPFGDDILRELSELDGSSTVDDPDFRVRVTPAPDGTIAVTALSLDRLNESINDFRRTLLIGGAVILALVAGALSLLVAWAVRPVTRMVTTATRIAEGELRTDVDAPTGSRETADLAVALDRMLIGLRATIVDREQAARSASEARDAMQRFLADVSHELRTPLTALKGYSDLHAGGMLDEPGALDRAMSRIGDESERLNGLVTDMLYLAREAPPTETFEPFDPTDVVTVVAEDLRAANPSLTIDVHIDIADDAPTFVVGLQARFHQALLNIGSNACQHAPPNSDVRFVVTSTNDDLHVEVIDHGLGVDSADAEHIFLPFYRPERSRERTGAGGAGLGLAIANQIIERHRGRITVEQTPGGGATFVITLPLATP